MGSRSYLHSLPLEVLLQILSRVPPCDLERLITAFPQGAAHDRILWHTFYLRAHGHAFPRNLYLSRGVLDWRRAYHAEQSRRRALRANAAQQLPATAAAATGTTSAPTTAPNARITVQQQGNMHRIRSTTSDRSAAPVVMRGNFARFDWSRRR